MIRLHQTRRWVIVGNQYCVLYEKDGNLGKTLCGKVVPCLVVKHGTAKMAGRKCAKCIGRLKEKD
jgi:hypothetical protein